MAKSDGTEAGLLLVQNGLQVYTSKKSDRPTIKHRDRQARAHTVLDLKYIIYNIQLIKLESRYLPCFLVVIHLNTHLSSTRGLDPCKPNVELERKVLLKTKKAIVITIPINLRKYLLESPKTTTNLLCSSCFAVR